VLIAAGIAAALGVPAAPAAAVKATATQQMKNVPLHERGPLLSAAIQAGTDAVQGRRVLLVDDLRRIAEVLGQNGRQLSFAREYVPGRVGWFGFDGRLVVLSDGEKIDVLDLASEAEQAWTAFLREHGYL
jgi:hypothetical protein